jgi:hypothetical protein
MQRLRDIDGLPEIQLHINSRSPLLKLPCEVLRGIAVTLADIWPASYPHCRKDAEGRPSLGWIVLGHVCSVLRAMLLDHRALWAESVCVFPSAQPEFLQRAGCLPISIIEDGGECSHTESRIQFIFENLHRAKRILCNGFPPVGKWEIPLDALSGKELPFLQDLIICLAPGRQSQNLTLDDTFDLPPMHVPSIRSVKIFNLYIPFNPSTLTHLELWNVHGYRAPSASNFFAMLRPCVKLQALTIAGEWIPDIAPTSNLEPTITLPYLTSLSMVGKVTSCVTLWSHVAFKPHISPSVTFVLRVAGSPVEQWSAAPNRMGRLMNRDSGSSSPINGLAVFPAAGDSENAANLAFLSSSPAARARKFPGFFARDFVVRLQLCPLRISELPTRRHLLEFAVSAVDVTCIGYLALDASGDDEDYASEDWCVALRRLPSVHTLYLQRAPRSIFKALSPAPASSAPLPFPHLAFLWICELDLRTGTGAGPSPENFLDFVEAHVPLERLKIDKLVVDAQLARETLLARLRESVARVECALD